MGMYDVQKDSYPGLSEELDNRAIRAMIMTWEYIASDCLVDDEGNPDENASVSRSEVLELVLDADRMANQDAEAARYTIWLSRFRKDHFKTVTHTAFPYKAYGC